MRRRRVFGAETSSHPSDGARRSEEIGKQERLLSFALVSNCATRFETILLRHGRLHHVRDDHVFRCAIYWPLYPSYAKEARELSPVRESQVEDKGDETSHTVVARKR
jgi:hypothetical protein